MRLSYSSVQPLRVIYNRAVYYGLRGNLDLLDFRKNWPEAHLLKTRICPLPHAAREHDLAVGDGLKHAPVFISAVPAMAMPGRMFISSWLDMMLVMARSLLVEVVMIGLGTQFAVRDPAIFHGKNSVIYRPAKMSADRFAIISYSGYFRNHSL
jgi:hypothetical protein